MSLFDLPTDILDHLLQYSGGLRQKMLLDIAVVDRKQRVPKKNNFFGPRKVRTPWRTSVKISRSFKNNFTNQLFFRFENLEP